MESVVYAVDWNQGRENTLSGAAWLGGSGTGASEVIEQLRKPTALVCSSRGAEKIAPAGGRNKRDELLLDLIRNTTSKGGTVLIPVDTSARVLELAYVLEHAWRQESNSTSENSVKGVGLYLASRNIGATIRYARSMLEWMDPNIVQEFEAEASMTGNQPHKRDHRNARNPQENLHHPGRVGDKTGGPFDLHYVTLLERRSQVDRVLADKKTQVILASDTSLAWGFSREILQRIAADPLNLIILTEDHGAAKLGASGNEQSLSRMLWDWFMERKDGVAMETGPNGQSFEQVYIDGRDLSFTYEHRTALEGRELSIYQQYLATQRQLQNTVQSGNLPSLETSADAIDETSSTSSSSLEGSNPERQGKALNVSTTLGQANRGKFGGSKESLGVNILLRQPGVYDYDVRGKKGRDTMFPYASKRQRIDDFGELIRPGDYVRADERVDLDSEDLRRSDNKQYLLGQKRKWEDSSVPVSGHRSAPGMLQHRKLGRDPRAEGTTDMRPSNGQPGGLENDEGSIADDSDREQGEASIGPSKLTYQIATVQANLRIAHVDYSGLHDQRSLSMLIPLIQPRKLVLVAGSNSETDWLAEECRQKLNAKSGLPEEGHFHDVFTPRIGETVTASMDTNAWTVKLSRALAGRVKFQTVRGLGVATLRGRLTLSNPEEQPTAESNKRRKLLKNETGASEAQEPDAPSKDAPESLPILDVLTSSMAAATRSVAQPLHVGDLRLADLRKILQAGGHVAEFRGEGTLLVDELVAVRKTATGLVEVEAAGLRLPDLLVNKNSFQAVKHRIYEGLAIVAGG